MQTIERAFFERNTVDVARDLLGVLLISHDKGKEVVGRIVETEAYPGLVDPASHAFIGQTKRNASLFGQPGRAYVYLSYGLHTCLNIVAHPKSAPAGGVLLRAVEPLEGIEIIKQRRKIDNLRDLTNGPGKVGQAFGIKLADNGVDVTKSESHIFLIQDPTYRVQYDSTKRIGITKNPDVLWRFIIPGNRWVSR